MTDLDTSIRQGLSHLVELTPMTPSIDEIASPTRKRKRRRRHAVRFGGFTLAALLAVGGPALALGISNPFARSYQTGDELTSRYGLSVAPSEVGHKLSAVSSAGPTLGMEVERRHGLVVRQGEFLPSGPVGPIYAQIIGLHTGAKEYAQVVVMTAQPKEAVAAAQSAAGTSVAEQIRFDGISARLWRPWGQNDSLVLSWQPTASVGVVVATGPGGFGTPASLHQLEQLAAKVKSLKKVPQLATNPISRVGGDGQAGGYWSLVPTFATRFGGVWNLPDPLLSNLLGTRIARINGWTEVDGESDGRPRYRQFEYRGHWRERQDSAASVHEGAERVEYPNECSSRADAYRGVNTRGREDGTTFAEQWQHEARSHSEFHPRLASTSLWDGATVSDRSHQSHRRAQRTWKGCPNSCRRARPPRPHRNESRLPVIRSEEPGCFHTPRCAEWSTDPANGHTSD